MPSKNIQISLHALFAFLILSLPVNGESSPLLRDLCISDGSHRCYFEVCFTGYNTYVHYREHIQEKFGLELSQYISSQTTTRTPCYLEKITPEIARKLKDETSIISPPVRAIRKSDIAPAYEDFLENRQSSKKADQCQPSEEEVIPPIEEAIILLDEETPLHGMPNTLRTILSQDNIVPPRLNPRLLGFLNTPGETDQIKINLSGFHSRLSTVPVELGSLYNRAGIIRIDPAPDLEFRSSTTSWVIQSGERDKRPFFGRNIFGSGEVVGIIDDLIDTNHCFFDGHGSPPGNNHRKLVAYQSRLVRAPSVHGTLVAGIIAGSASVAPEDPDGGQAPAAKIAFASVWDFAAQGPISSTLYQTFVRQYNSGARIFSNSWGDKKRRWYTNWSLDIDRFSWDNEDALVLFAAHNDGTITSPENAKNAIAVGATKQANFDSELGSGGSGLTCDGRLKPEIFAPGCRVRSAAAGTTCGLRKVPSRHPDPEPGSDPDLHSATHLATPRFNHSIYSSDCATSWATPAVAGAAALAREHYKKKCMDPTGALLKATLLNGTVDMESVIGEGGKKYPNELEGWGKLRLDDAIEFQGDFPDSRKSIVFDCRRPRGFKPTLPSQYQDYLIEVESSGSEEPLKITLAWTEPPPAWIERNFPVVNNLDLRLEQLDCPTGQECFFLGNNFIPDKGVSRRYSSVQEGTTDLLNNVEQILIDKPKSGWYLIRVEGTKVHVSKQGFALVATGNIKEIFRGSECPN